MIEVKYNPKEFELTVSGHAMSKSKKPDIYCAGVSSLVFALCKTLGQALAHGCLKENGLSIERERGYAHIKCDPLEDYIPNIETIFMVIINGLEAEAESYPQYVSFIPVD